MAKLYIGTPLNDIYQLRNDAISQIQSSLFHFLVSGGNYANFVKAKHSMARDTEIGWFVCQ
jgi:hypothetical protein